MRRDRLCFAAAALCASMTTVALADTKTFDLDGFSGISASEGLHVFVTTNKAFEITAESDNARQLDRLELEVRGTTLVASMDSRPLSLFQNKGWQVSVWVSLPTLVQAEASSGAQMSVDVMNGSALKLTASSGASLLFEAIAGDTISVDATSGARIESNEGTCGSLSANLSSGAILEMMVVECGQVQVDASSGSVVDVNAQHLIDATASSGAAIRVYGAHELMEIDTSSGGTVEIQ